MPRVRDPRGGAAKAEVISCFLTRDRPAPAPPASTPPHRRWRNTSDGGPHLSLGNQIVELHLRLEPCSARECRTISLWASLAR